MSRFYINPEIEDDKWSLPNGEAFYAKGGEWYTNDCGERCEENDEGAKPNDEGWYWWVCLPGCMPDSEPNGPFDTEEDAINNARETHGE